MFNKYFNDLQHIVMINDEQVTETEEFTFLIMAGIDGISGMKNNH